MAGARGHPERVALPRQFPSRALGRSAGYLIISVISVGGMLLLFGEEPRRLAGDQINLLAFLPYALMVGLAIGAIPPVVAVFRRPLVTADHYSLTVRAGIWRTLVLPWAKISELALYPAALREDPEPILLVRCAERHGPLGDAPGWWDQSVLRAAAKAAGGAIGGYDVAVRLDDFVGDPRQHLAAVSQFASGRIAVVDRLSAPRGKRHLGA